MATVQLAMRETAEALLFQEMPYALRLELESQLARLAQFVKQSGRH